MRSKEVEEAINNLKEDVKYADLRDTVDGDCTICYIEDLDKVLNYISELEETNRLLLSNNAKKSEEINKLKCENHDMKEQLQFFIPRRRVRRVYKQLGKILKQDGITDDLDEE